MWERAIFPFPTVFSKICTVTADTKNKGLFGKGLVGSHTSRHFHVYMLLFQQVYLTHSLIHRFESVPNSKKLQTTTEMWLLTLYSMDTYSDTSTTDRF